MLTYTRDGEFLLSEIILTVRNACVRTNFKPAKNMSTALRRIRTYNRFSLFESFNGCLDIGCEPVGTKLGGRHTDDYLVGAVNFDSLIAVLLGWTLETCKSDKKRADITRFTYDILKRLSERVPAFKKTFDGMHVDHEIFGSMSL